jgi:hypothetical protein
MSRSKSVTRSAARPSLLPIPVIRSTEPTELRRCAQIALEPAEEEVALWLDEPDDAPLWFISTRYSMTLPIATQMKLEGEP